MLSRLEGQPFLNPPEDWFRPLSQTPVLTYFFPHDHKDPSVLQRANTLGRTRLTNETRLVQIAKPLFKGHIQPNTYCIDTDGKITDWSDADPSAIARQIELAQEYGINGFVVDAYVERGRDGTIKSELQKPLDLIAQQTVRSSTKFCLMTSVRRPRAIIPIPPGYNEPNRYYPFEEETLYAMVDYLAKFWDNPNYFHIDDRPVLGVYGLTSSVLRELVKNMGIPAWEKLGETMALYSVIKYHVHPYLIGVVDSPQMVDHVVKAGFDMVTTYAGLVDFYPELISSPYKEIVDPKSLSPFQHYNEQLAKQIQAWQRIVDLLIYNFIPSAVTGWDATARGELGVTLNDVKGQYPFTPIIVDATPEKFYNMLKAIYRYLPTRISQLGRLFIVCAFNEITEGAALLPVLRNGQVDYGYLNALKLFIANLRSNKLDQIVISPSEQGT